MFFNKVYLYLNISNFQFYSLSWVIFSCSPPLFDHWTLKSQNSCSRLIKLLISSDKKNLLDHVGPLIKSEQHGFCSGRSCTSNLLESLDCILDMVDEGIPVDI